MKKYELTENKQILPGRTLFQIRALTSFRVAGGHVVNAGDLGGWLEKEGNLSHDGNAWVYDDAQVYGNAQISGNARVYDDAQVYGNAQISGNARISGDARVSGNAWVYGDAWVYGNARISGNAWETSPLYIQGSRWSLNMISKTMLRIGCEIHTLDEWRENCKEIAAKNRAEDVLGEYLLYIELFCKMYGEAASSRLSSAAL